MKSCFLDENKAYITFASKEVAIETNYKLKYERQLRINEQPVQITLLHPKIYTAKAEGQ